MPQPNKTSITVETEVRAMYDEIARDQTAKREVRVTVPQLLKMIATKIRNGEITL